MPPEEMWLDDEALADHFENVKRKMRSPHSSDDEWEEIESAGVQNEWTKDLTKG